MMAEKQMQSQIVMMFSIFICIRSVVYGCIYEVLFQV